MVRTVLALFTNCRLGPDDVGELDGRVIYSFQTGNDGNSPISNLVRDAAGNLYGTDQ